MQQPPNPYRQYPQQQWQQPPMPPQQQWNPQQPPFPPQQYQPPMQPPKKNSRKRFWLILVAVVLVLAVIIGVASQGQSQPPAPTTQATQQPTNAPTKQAPTPTAIPVLRAVLGGTEANFNATFGADTNTAGRARNYIFSVDGQQGRAIVMLDDNDPNVRFITLKPVNAGSVWNATIGQDAVHLFLPGDAKHIKDIQDPTIGTEHVYTSARLAKTFPASSFTDVNSGKQVAAGTFYFNCDNGQNQDNPTHVGACTIGLGQ